MATPTIKSTNSIDPQTLRDLERLARHFGMSKSEILRRAVHALAQQEETQPEEQSLLALEALQKSVGLTAEGAEDWATQVRRERVEVPG